MLRVSALAERDRTALHASVLCPEGWLMVVKMKVRLTFNCCSLQKSHNKVTSRSVGIRMNMIKCSNVIIKAVFLEWMVSN